jgi:pyruvate/2-oxoglutarate dehydrogenase complex dihydrolipoamide dehydrogenase (E3) component
MSYDSILLPYGAANQELESHVRPRDWVNPTTTGRYNLVVVGAGTAGLVTAAGAAGLGAKVALVERGLMGGDCLNVGCVPSKAVIAAARAAAAVRDAEQFGVNARVDAVDFGVAMERMRALRARISPNDSAKRFQGLGVDVYFGQGRFLDSSTLGVDGTKLSFKRAVIATGARAAAPPIPGLDAVEYLTNETLFSLTEIPPRLGIIGAGPIGCEMAQSFARLGSQVFLIEAEHGVLPREDREAADIVQRSLVHDNVKVLCCGQNLRITSAGNRPGLSVDSHGVKYAEVVDKLLVAVGRKPNVEGLNLEAIGVQYDKKGVTVNDFLQTTNPRIYAAGDVCSPFQFTHAADFMARTVIQNSLFMGRAKASRLTIPWCTYTSPEVAHVGLYEKQAQDKGVPVDTFVQHFHDVDRAVLEGEEEGFAKVHVKSGTDHILGATIVAPHAGEMISEITLAMTGGLGLKRLGNTIHPYPTQAEAIRKLGDQYNKTRLTPRIKNLFQTWLKWTR